MQQLVNYYLDYRTSETNKAPSAGSTSVNYCLVYGTSETSAQDLLVSPLVNYCLIYRTSETAKSKWIENHYGELLLDLRCLRNLNVS